MGVGGLPRVAETLCRTIDPARFEVQLLCLNFLGDIGEQLRRDGYTVHDLPRPHAGPDYGASRRIAAIYRQERIDVVHTHNTQALMHGGLAIVQAPGRRLIHTDHARPFPDQFKYHVIERVLSTLAHRMVGVSAHTTENLRRYEWIPRRKLETIVNGIDPRLFDRVPDRAALRASVGVATDAELLIVGARLEPQKGLTYLVQAVARLAPQRPRLRLVIAGIGSLQEPLAAEAAALGIADRVHFVGVRHDMAELLQVSDAFVLSSNWEGLPMIVLEALAARCPIVATRVGGVPSAVRDDETGLLVPPQDPQALADAIARTLDDAPGRIRRAAAGRALFDAEFSAAAMSRRYEALYE